MISVWLILLPAALGGLGAAASRAQVPPARGASGEAVPPRAAAGAGAEGPVLHREFLLDYLEAEEFLLLLQKDAAVQGRFAARAGGNRLMVWSRDAAVLAQIGRLKDTLDVDRQETRYRPLANADVEDVAKLLARIYPQEGGAEESVRAELAAALRSAGVGEDRVGEVVDHALSVAAGVELSIVTDVARHGLLIRAYSGDLPGILELIEELDQPRRQVLLDVFIAGLRLDETAELSVDFTNTSKPAANGQVLGGAGDRLSGFDNGTDLSYQLISGDSAVLVRALQRTGQLELISRPQMIIRDDTPAHLRLGRDVPAADQARVGEEGAGKGVLNYERVGTKLEVRPQIQAGNYVMLTIQRHSDVGTETLASAPGANAEAVSGRSAAARVRVRDGQTVCLSGWVRERVVESRQRVPLLADIPLLGLLFERRCRQPVQEEVIIFITPHILAQPEAANPPAPPNATAGPQASS